MKQHGKEQLIFLGLLIIIFAWAAWEATGFTGQARTYPLVVGTAALVIGLAEFGAYTFTLRRQASTQEGTQSAGETLGQRFSKALPYLSWLAGLYAMIYVIGMVISSGIFAFLFLLREGKMRWYYALLSGISVIIFLIIIQDVMSLKWPKSIIDPLDWIGLG